MASGGFRQRLAQSGWPKYVVLGLVLLAAVAYVSPYVAPKKTEIAKITQAGECQFETKAGDQLSFGNSYWKQTPCDVMQPQVAKLEGKNAKFAIGGIGFIPASTPVLGSFLGERVVWVGKPTKDEIRNAREEAKRGAEQEAEENSQQSGDSEREARNSRVKDQDRS